MGKVRKDSAGALPTWEMRDSSLMGLLDGDQLSMSR